ncbi:MAG: hypothetical protein KGN01_07445 [Patescibacteria group bacterium]|nr:hypothetical protein [Patescibacteria group bacterium]
MSWFFEIVSILRGFELHEAPYREISIEDKLARYLESRNVSFQRQKTSRLGRYDLVILKEGHRIVLELKKKATSSCVEQLDRYSRDFDGMILMSYKSTRTLKAIFEIAKKSAKIPIEIVDIRDNCDLV